MIKFIKTASVFIIDIFKNRSLIYDLSKRDLKIRFAGSYLGFFWAFIQPVITVLILWFIVEVGFKSGPVGDTPFILWLITGIIPYNFFADGINQASNSIIENSFLVKKIVFRVNLLPVVKIFAAFIVHLFFIILLFLIFSIYGLYPTLYSTQILYYMFATVLLLLSISWATSAVTVLFRDLSQIIQTGLQLVFWGTPIFWSIESMPESIRWILKLNPMYYIVDGYRNCFIYQRWFWYDLQLTIYFWCIVSLFLVIGITVFSTLRSHFADVI